MLRFLVSSFLILCSTNLLANECLKELEKASQQSMPIIPRWNLQVDLETKNRVDFHNAPTVQCKIRDLFIIRGDSITAYDLYKDSNGVEWVFGIFYSKRIDLESEIVEGWLKLSEFR